MYAIDITEFYYNAAPMDYSASVVEIGQHAASDTWQAAIDDSDVYWFVNDENRDELIGYFEGFGAWDDLQEWADRDLNALFIQFVSSELRKIEAGGETPGNIFWEGDSLYFEL